MKINLYFLLSLLAISSTLWGQTTTINDGDWTNAGNWNNGVPNSGSDATILNDMTLNTNLTVDGFGSYTIDGGSIIDPAGGMKYKLKIEDDAQMVVDGNLTIEGDLEVKDNANLIIKGCDTMRIEGKLKFKDNSTVTIEDCGVLIVSKDAKIEDNAQLVVDGNLNIEKDIEVKNNANLTLKGCDTIRVEGKLKFKDNSTVTIEDCAALIVSKDAKFEDNSSILIDGNLFVEGKLEAKDDASVSGNGLIEVNEKVKIKNNSNLFGSNSDCNPGPCQYGTGAGLPITLHSFSARLTDNRQIEVNWQTSSEINNDYFTIEASTNGRDYASVKTISGAGNSQKLLHYQTVIEPLEANVNYIRLKQTDFDGQFEIFPPRAVNIEPANFTQATQAKIFPNPGNGEQLYLMLKTPETANYQIRLYDLSGQLLKEMVYRTQGDRYNEEIELLKGLKLRSGIYIIHLLNEKEKLSFKYLVR